jgi:DNA-directed RNA polymerase specialized sigma24 family protein
MAPSPSDEIEGLIAAWHAAGAAKELFEALRDPMRRAARRGIRRILAETPDEGDVDDVVFKAFIEFLDKDPSGIRASPTGFACTIADRRGRDRARSIIRERERIQGNAWKIDQMFVTESDVAEAAERERLFRYASECIEHLTPEQRDVIERTVQRQESLSDWVAARGTSYEAGRRLRERGLAALRRCIDGKSEREKGRSDG